MNFGNTLFNLLVAGTLLSGAATAQSIAQFEGIDASNDPVAGYTVDPNGAVGTLQYLEWVDQAYQGYDKVTGLPVYPNPQRGTTPWAENNMPNCTTGGGNGVILFDHLASRWMIGLREGGPSYYYCVAISNTDDLTSPTFQWYTYELPLNPLITFGKITYYPDYPKIATWPDAYYVTLDLENQKRGFMESGVLVCAFDRVNMLNGATARTPQCFPYPQTLGPLFLGHSLLPADIEGSTPPAVGSPEEFVSIENPSGTATTSTSLNLWQFHVDWTAPANSTFTGPTPLTVASYQPGCYTVKNPTNTYCVPQPTTPQTGNRVDSLGDRLMHRFAFRQFPGYESFLVTHAVQVAPTGIQTGIRWYELRSTGGSDLNIANFGTFSPDKNHFRWVPSAAQDKLANMAMGYSISSVNLHPSINAATVNLQSGGTPKEFTLLAGTADEENSSHWGGYTSMTVDPADDCTFWYVNEYFDTNQTGTSHTWQTRVSHFKVTGCQ